MPDYSPTMRNDDRTEARAIGRHWHALTFDPPDHPVETTMEGAAGFAIAHALLAIAKAILVLARAVERRDRGT